MDDDRRNPDREDFPHAAELAKKEIDAARAGKPLPPPEKPHQAPPALPQPPANLETVDQWPGFTKASEVPANIRKQITMKYPELIEGFVHRGTKVVLGGASKSYKSWMMLYMGLCIATGRDYFGRATIAGPVVWINLEIPHEFAMLRVLQVCQAMGIELPDNFYIWSLRGLCSDFTKLAPVLKMRAEQIRRETGQDILAIFLDPLYKGLGDRDENAAGDMASLMAELDEICKATGAAIVVSHHFAKGSAAAKDAQDRMSGSGVIARDADTIFVMTPHEEENAYTISLIARNFPGVPDFVVRWDHPIFHIDDSLNPHSLRQPGRPKSFDPEQILALLPSEGLRAGEWQAKCEEEGVCKRRAFYNTVKQLEEDELIEKTLDRRWVKVVHK